MAFVAILIGGVPVEMTVTLFPVPGFTPSTVLVKAKAAFSFGLHTTIQHSPASTSVGTGKDASNIATPPSATIGLPGSMADSFSHPNAGATTMSIPSVVTQLLVGCRRKVVVYTWKDGEAQEIKVCFIYSSVPPITYYQSFRRKLLYLIRLARLLFLMLTPLDLPMLLIMPYSPSLQ